MSQSDPTDHALAAIASIRDQPEARPEPEKAVVEEKPIAVELIEADGYHKVGPGPMATIRIKWTARREDNGDYYVDETIGENSTPIVSGPMARDAAIRFVDECESEAQCWIGDLGACPPAPSPPILALETCLATYCAPPVCASAPWGGGPPP